MQTADRDSQLLSDRSKTITFTVPEEKEDETRRTLITIYEALREKGYNPINQLVGYILSEDPTYITNYKNARSLIRRIDRDELLNTLVRNYLGL
ncbi:MAG: IreB family regulatory phosphoprotein [Clostridia bacterium]|nr:IreB family regulatory phosphoprotein [Clostridia bacterium]